MGGGGGGGPGDVFINTGTWQLPSGTGNDARGYRFKPKPGYHTVLLFQALHHVIFGWKHSLLASNQLSIVSFAVFFFLLFT